ncbi:MAG: hypothetical protein AB7O24_16830 [Kofleriaceae bacterium]
MRTLLLLALFTLSLASACSKDSPSSTMALANSPPSGDAPELERFEEHIGKPFHGAFVSKRGLYIDGKLAVDAKQLATPGKLQQAVAAHPLKSPAVVFDILDEPSPLAFSIMRELAGQDLEFSLVSHSGEGVLRVLPMCRLAIANRDDDDTEQVNLVIDVATDHAAVGMSRIDDYFDIRDRAEPQRVEVSWAKLERVLAELKPTMFFADRRDAKIAIDPSFTSGVLLRVADMACTAGFVELSFVRREDVEMKPAIANVVDLDGLATAAQVFAKLREHAGQDAFTPRVKARELCLNITVNARSTLDPSASFMGRSMLVRTSGRIWISTVRDEVELQGLAKAIRMTMPFELAAERGVDATTLFSVISATCDAGISELELREPHELKNQP